jgi:hypothetical protein
MSEQRLVTGSTRQSTDEPKYGGTSPRFTGCRRPRPALDSMSPVRQ